MGISAVRLTLAVLAAALIAATASDAQITLGVYRGSSGGGAIVNACASLGNQADFSDATGCNLVWAGH